MDEHIPRGAKRESAGRSYRSAKAIGALAAPSLEPAARARGFTTIALLQDWGIIAGADLARFTRPDKVIWPRRRPAEEDDQPRQHSKRPEGATLILRVDGPRAIEVQYRAQQIMERVNGYFGYRAIVEMRIVQAPVGKARQAASLRPLGPDHISEAMAAEILPQSAAGLETGLKTALLRLGAAIRGCKA